MGTHRIHGLYLLKATDTVVGLTKNKEQRQERHAHQQNIRQQNQRREDFRHLCDLQNPDKILKPIPMSTDRFALYDSDSDSDDDDDEEVEPQNDYAELDSSFEVIEPENDCYKARKVSAATEDHLYETVRQRYIAPSKKEIAYHTMRESVEAAGEVSSTLAKKFEAGGYLDATKVVAMTARNGACQVGAILGKGAKFGVKYGFGFAKMAITPLLFNPRRQRDGTVDATAKQIQQNWQHDERSTVYGANQASGGLAEEQLRRIKAEIRDAMGEAETPNSVPMRSSETRSVLEKQESTIHYSVHPPFTTSAHELDGGTRTYPPFKSGNVFHRVPSPPREQSVDVKEPGRRKEVVGKRKPRASVRRGLESIEDNGYGNGRRE
jgi:hypothetical protein